MGPLLRALLYCIPLLLLGGAAQGQEPAEENTKLLSGMSIVGNDEAPKSLVLVPWKSSELGRMLGVSKILDDGCRPVDKDVFLRELAYYQIQAASR